MFIDGMAMNEDGKSQIDDDSLWNYKEFEIMNMRKVTDLMLHPTFTVGECLNLCLVLPQYY